MYTCSMETIYLSLVHTGSWGTFFMKSPVSKFIKFVDQRLITHSLQSKILPITYRWFHMRYLECTLVQWRLSIYPWGHTGSWGTFFMKSPVSKFIKIRWSEADYPSLQNKILTITYRWFHIRYLECTLIQWRLSIYPWGHR